VVKMPLNMLVLAVFCARDHVEKRGIGDVYVILSEKGDVRSTFISIN